MKQKIFKIVTAIILLIYTGLRRFYNDFGYIGVMGMQFLYGFLFRTIYTTIRNFRTLDSKKVWITITYSYVLFAVLTQAMEDHFWIDLSLGFIIELLVVWMCTKLILEFRLKKGAIILIRKWKSFG